MARLVASFCQTGAVMETLITILVIGFAIVAVGAVFLLGPTVRARRSGLPHDAGTGVDAGRGATGTIAPPEAGTDQPGTLAPAAEPAVPAAPEVERPPPSAGRMAKLRSRLARSQNAFGSALLNLLSSGKLDDETWEEIEEILITADMGAGPATQLVDRLRTEVKVAGTRDLTEVKALLKSDLLEQVNPDLDRTLHTEPHGDRPAVVLVVGVSGTGKTTTCGKLARVLIGDGQTVLLGAADTFRAAAADQLETWGSRVGAKTVRADREGADPAS